jgi:allophanate hydrolase
VTIAGLRADYGSGVIKPGHVIERLLPRLDADPAVWISRFDDAALLERAGAVESLEPSTHPLRGIPFAVKDNIDVAGLPTTAGCPAFSYRPERNASVVQMLLDAGAICIGKTNLDQFATGLVGVRSPYGVPGNPYGRDFIPGGSSSGSAVAVARDLVAFSLGTDTAGSGRVPAAFNNLFGWKPTRGLVSTRGVVPACRTLDCVSVFAQSVGDVQTVAGVISRFDSGDAYARELVGGCCRAVRRIGIPRAGQLEFFGDTGYAGCWSQAVAELVRRGLTVVEVDFGPFLEAARLLYGGPWVAERYLAARSLIESDPSALHPVTREIIAAGGTGLAVDVFAAQYRLAELRREAEKVWGGVDLLCTPTAGTIYRTTEVEADPVRLNSNLGYYTNFLNLLDLCGMAVPAGFRPDGMPFGVTYIAPAFHDSTLMAFAGAQPDPAGTMLIAVCGAHMRGLPLNHQLADRGAVFERAVRTAPVYRMYALDEKRPGMVRAAAGGAALEVEIWRLPAAMAGSFLEGIPSPLGLGRVMLEDGRNVCGFLCEQVAVEGKPDITHLGGWRSWLAARN